MMETVIVNTRTQKELKELMEIIRADFKSIIPFSINTWEKYRSHTCVRIYKNDIGYSPIRFYRVRYKNIPIITLKQFKSMKKATPAAKKSAPKKEEIIHRFKTTTKTQWQIIKVGKEFMTRHVATNGNILAINPKQFNNVQNAFKNIRANAGAQLVLNKAAKGKSLSLTSINSYQKCCPK